MRMMMMICDANDDYKQLMYLSHFCPPLQPFHNLGLYLHPSNVALIMSDKIRVRKWIWGSETGEMVGVHPQNFLFCFNLPLKCFGF
uniref:Uncharacterized protein n=1 Tax=Octopus bimaculoides TaxID=37653 RepID=A0A0L8FZI9_OCTBM